MCQPWLLVWACASQLKRHRLRGGQSCWFDRNMNCDGDHHRHSSLWFFCWLFWLSRTHVIDASLRNFWVIWLIMGLGLEKLAKTWRNCRRHMCRQSQIQWGCSARSCSTWPTYCYWTYPRHSRYNWEVTHRSSCTKMYHLARRSGGRGASDQRMLCPLL